MRTLQAQRLKRLIEHECQNRHKVLEEIMAAAKAEAEKLASLLADSGEMILRETDQQVSKEDQEDDEATYLEQGVIER